MNLLENYSLQEYNTFGIAIKTKYFVEIDSFQTLTDAINWATTNKITFHILGGGSNTVFTQDFDGLVMWMNIKGKNIVQENEKEVIISVKSGEIWHETVMWTIEQGYAGLENLVLIPGNVGAAPIQNIGAYGVEVKEVIDSVEVFDLQNNKIENINNSDCKFEYRNSVFKQNKNRYIVISVTFKLKKTAFEVNLSYAPIANYFKQKKIKNPTPFEVANVVMDIRKSKLPDPKILGNCGSFFKNPIVNIEIFKKIVSVYPDVPSFKVPHQDDMIKIPAGWLIETCGFKGKKIGNVGVHDKQALVLVNYGKATGNEVLNLANEIVKTVENKFGILLEMEVNLV